MIVLVRWFRTAVLRAGALLDHARWIVLSLVLALVGIIGLVVTVPAWLNILLAVLSVALLVLEVRAHVTRLADIQFVLREGDDFEDVRASVAGSTRFEVIAAGTGHVLLDHAATAAVVDGTARARLSETSFVVPRVLRTAGIAFQRRRIARGATYNGSLVGLGTDLGLGDTLASAEWRFVPARYWDHLATDIFAMQDVLGSGHQLGSLGRELFVDRHGSVRDFGDSWLLNGVGSSVIALTTDARVVLVRQSRKNESSRGLLAPSGSGSLEPADFRGASDLAVAELAANGGTRELAEETGIPLGSVTGSEFLGFGRWLEKAAKPELFTLVTLGISSHDVQEHRIPGADRPYSLAVETLRLRPDVSAWNDADPATVLEDVTRLTLSVPTSAGLALMARAAADPGRRAGGLVRDVLAARAAHRG